MDFRGGHTSRQPNNTLKILSAGFISQDQELLVTGDRADLYAKVQPISID